MTTPAQREVVAKALFRRDFPKGDARHWTLLACRFFDLADELIAAYEAAAWQPIETAPKDGTPIETKNYSDLDATDLVRWSEARVCMLGSVAPGAGMCGSGWSSIDAGNLPVDEPEQWRLPSPPKDPDHD